MKVVRVNLYIYFTSSVGTAISVNFDCSSILTRVSEIHFLAFFCFFPTLKESIETSVEYACLVVNTLDI